LIGKHDDGSKTERRLAEISTTESSLAAYGLWEGNDMIRMVLINSDTYLPGQAGPRGKMRIKLHDWEEGQYASVKRLYTPYTNSYSGV